MQWLSLVLMAMLAGTAAAHHSFAMYDASMIVTVDGTVVSFQWTNPHVVIGLMAPPLGGGAPTLWTVELTSPGNLTRGGWTRTTLKPGDKARVQLNPWRDGRPGGGFVQMTLPDGRVLQSTFGPPPGH